MQVDNNARVGGAGMPVEVQGTSHIRPGNDPKGAKVIKHFLSTAEEFFKGAKSLMARHVVAHIAQSTLLTEDIKK